MKKQQRRSQLASNLSQRAINSSKQASINLSNPVSHRGSNIISKRRDMANPHLINALNAINGSMDSVGIDHPSITQVDAKVVKKNVDTTPRRTQKQKQKESKSKHLIQSPPNIQFSSRNIFPNVSAGGGTNESHFGNKNHQDYIQNQDLMGLGNDDDYEDFDHQLNDERQILKRENNQGQDGEEFYQEETKEQERRRIEVENIVENSRSKLSKIDLLQGLQGNHHKSIDQRFMINSLIGNIADDQMSSSRLSLATMSLQKKVRINEELSHLKPTKSSSLKRKEFLSSTKLAQNTSNTLIQHQSLEESAYRSNPNEIIQENVESINNKIKNNKIMKSSTKNNSPKRKSDATIPQSTTNKKQVLSLERKEGQRYSQKTDLRKGINQQFSTAIAQKKPEAIVGKSQNASIKKGNFSKNDQNQFGGSRLGVRQQNETKTPGKFKKSTYLNSYKKSSNIQNIASAKQMLNQSITSVSSNNQFNVQKKNSYLNIQTPSNQTKTLNSFSQNQRIGIHQSSDMISPDVPASRQMISSPFKSKNKTNFENNQLQIFNRNILTAKKSSKEDRTQQRSLVNSNLNSAKRVPSMSHTKEDTYGARIFNSKSPSKKSLQLQQILKSISMNAAAVNNQSAQYGKKRNATQSGNPQTEIKNHTSKSSSLIRNFINQATSIPNTHGHTKSYQLIGLTNESNDQSSQLESVTQKSFRNSHVNPYIQTKNRLISVGANIDSKFQNRHTDSRKNKEAPLSSDRNIFSANMSMQAASTNKQKQYAKDEIDQGDKKFAVLAQSIKQRIEASTQNTYYNKKENKEIPSKNQTRNHINLTQQKETRGIKSPTNMSDMKGNILLLTDRSEQVANRRNNNEKLNEKYQEMETKTQGNLNKGGGYKKSDLQMAKKDSEIIYFKNPTINKIETRNNKDLEMFQSYKPKHSIPLDTSDLNEARDGEIPPSPSHDVSLSCENIDELNLHQSSIQTPKKVSDMNCLKFQPKTKNSLSPIKSTNQDNSDAVILGNVLKNVPSIRKETKYMEISFSQDMSNQEANLIKDAISPDNDQKISPIKKRRGRKESRMKSKQYSTLEKKQYSPYKDQYDESVKQYEEEQKDTDQCDITEEVSDDGGYVIGASPNFGNGARKAIQEIQAGQKPVDAFVSELIDTKPKTRKSDIIAASNVETQTVLSSYQQSQSEQDKQSSSDSTPIFHGDGSYPMTAAQFLKLNREKMLDEEINELGSEQGQFKTIYYPGTIPTRHGDDLEILKSLNQEKIIEFNEKAAAADDNNNGEFQGNPIFDNFEGYYKVQIGEHIAYRYEIMKVLGKGSFAQVVQCRDYKQKNQPILALKITRNTEMDHKFAHKEAQYLKYIMQEDPNDKHNIVRMLDQCYFREHQCFVFELLHTDLFEHLKATGFVGFSTDKIRDYALQILKGLVFLEKHKIIHCDLKPENILCADTMCRNLKLVDFGSGCFRDEQIYTYVQSRFYRSPEVILRIKYTEKVDIWSLGCILAELYTGEPIFPGNNEQEQLELIMELCGMPPESMVDKSRKKEHYFDTDYSPFLIEDEELGILRIPNSRPLRDAVPCEDNEFLDFVKKCLVIDPETRFSASEAMEHPWIKAALQDALRKNKIQDPRLIVKQKPGKRMGQNESNEREGKIYQPQILREQKEYREREGDGAKEIPAEQSPEREIIAQRKKQIQKPNKESFGIKLNNLNLIQGTSISGTKKAQLRQATEIKVTDFIAEQLAASNFDSRGSGDDNTEHDEIMISPEIVTSSQKQQISVDGVAARNAYFSTNNQIEGAVAIAIPTGKQKSIIPEIDFTNKYVRRNEGRQSAFNSRNDYGGGSAISPEGSQNKHTGLNQAFPQQPLHQSPFRNKFVHMSEMEESQQFDHDETDAPLDDEHPEYQQSQHQPQAPQQQQLINSGLQQQSKKKVMTNTYFLPSQ